MKPLFINKELKADSKLTRDLNSQNGNDSEVISAANLIQALNAELRWGTRNEDNSKIDLLLSFNHPWIIGKRTLLLCQVKSGSSFGKITNNTIKLYSKGIKEAQKSQNDICLVWYDHLTRENYWAYIHSNSIPKVVELGKNHILSPATKFEVARCISRSNKLKNFNSRGVILNFKKIKLIPISKHRKNIRTSYKNIKKINNPLYGNIEISKYGWKHMFRKTRLKSYKNDSLIVIPYLKQLLSFQPDRHWVISFENNKHNQFTILKYEHVLRYEKIKNNENDKTYEVVIKLIEEVGFPTNWKNENLLSQKVFRKTVLKSCSLKKMV
ncbi:hypothetical protein EG346_15055 [Chryseobacterium carnipullorum]|uniref:DUF4365 domain-containing protein n=1 Tax=Chryseobacterium carnipullorum TaxID=1124835 RepID=A0A376DRR4_CHRCU|nr:hypothetical protein [Chryseobacterium carnipullorum]AZA49417.1 hypothetical protein EG346_15055 [Chryseobacterium carnipullorum]AZA64308.1 hypothetical protein EG345_06010 [Chryseobacterium carnipullorum]STC94300.1 Uncharacterised protein [Chryseobacterium carnipullorum]